MKTSRNFLKMTLTMLALTLSLVVTAAFAIPAKKENLFQGDMLLTEEQDEVISLGGDVAKVEEDGEDKEDGKPKSSASAVGLKALLWENKTVPYVIKENAKCIFGWICVTRPEEAIKSAMKEIEEKSCVKFVERTNQPDYLEFGNEGFSQCYSYVGRIRGVQEISLSTGCGSHGVALHEIMHALGFHHEQSRPDRDDYVTILEDNISEDFKKNFRKYSFTQIKTFGTPYDYGSIMHYPETAFNSFPFTKTIVAKDGSDIGQREKLSKLDIEALNKLYEC